MNYMTVEELSTLWFDDFGERFDTYEEWCVDNFYHLIMWTPVEFFESVDANGVLDPLRILIDSNNEMGISNGHHRFIAAVLLGLYEVPVEFVRRCDSNDGWTEYYSGPDSRAGSNPTKNYLDYDIGFVGSL